MKKLILDYSKWRSGDRSVYNSLGRGTTQLLNDEGYMCCLGQFTPQLVDKTIVNEFDMLGEGNPCDLNVNIPFLTSEDEDESGDITYVNSQLSEDAISINDAYETTPEEKIQLLKDLFLKYEIEIEVINQPVKSK